MARQTGVDPAPNARAARLPEEVRGHRAPQAPHEVAAKEATCGCAGIFNAPYALEAYLKAFDEDKALDRFEAFASLNGPAFYGLAPNEERVTLERGEIVVEKRVADLVPFLAGETLGWRLAG